MYPSTSTRWVAALAVMLILAACQPIQPVNQTNPPAGARSSGTVSPSDPVDAQIANAMSAGPAVVGRDATILGWDASGMPTVVLRKGTNEWTCLADWPASPGNDPQCFDPVWTAWNDAYMAGKQPKVTRLGVGYMLAGGSDPSNTDPMATAPLPGEDWVTSPPHLMLLIPGDLDPAVFGTDHTSGKPYIMWEGTPYEHLMVPTDIVLPSSASSMTETVSTGTVSPNDPVEAQIANAMSAGPDVVGRDATILGWDASGMPTVVLRKGTNEWTCLADWPVSPGNDPQCFDPVWTAWNDTYMAGKQPNVTRLGVGYMLAGGSDPSNTDPMATAPLPGEAWVTSPPHLMLLIPGDLDPADFTTDHTSGKPYIMWEGTPYEHLMVPVAPAVGGSETHEH